MEKCKACDVNYPVSGDLCHGCQSIADVVEYVLSQKSPKKRVVKDGDTSKDENISS